ncbi:MAG: hypothetical protein Q8M00_00480 [bacterium]|nr:hypothetical protein [bacterium]
MIVGIDLDGTISKAGFYNPSLRLPWWLFVVLVPLVLLIVPDKKAVGKLKEMKIRGHRIIIISARPPWATAITIKWLKFHKVPLDEVFCIGFGKGTRNRKLEVIKREKIECFFDDNKKLVDFLNRNSVMATRL